MYLSFNYKLMYSGVLLLCSSYAQAQAIRQTLVAPLNSILANSIKPLSSLSASGRALVEVSWAYALLGPAV